jgi:hypothetical protein
MRKVNGRYAREVQYRHHRFEVMLSMNQVGRGVYRIEVVNHLNCQRAKFLRQFTQMRAVNNGDVPALPQTNYQVAHVHFYSRARGTAEAGN